MDKRDGVLPTLLITGVSAFMASMGNLVVTRGTLLVASGLLGIVYGMVRSTSPAWGSPQVIAPIAPIAPLAAIAAGVPLLAGFAAWERRMVNPVVPPRLFRRRGFTLSNLVGMLVQFGLFGGIFLLTQFLQHVLRSSPLDAGLRTLPWTVVPVLVTPLAGAFGDRIGGKRLMVAATVLQASALAWFAVVASGRPLPGAPARDGGRRGRHGAVLRGRPAPGAGLRRGAAHPRAPGRARAPARRSGAAAQDLRGRVAES
ncbi:hypothetical protein ACFFMN_18870 [Planobispora siamensis]|uniref:Major Facilitator Superfamily protein n=1 Tax=Planobispora siamensis TaxID=936338 RepID=A0A8J3SLB5_9ACTN|nr:hypothetical protein [Planobispora siamensis]GIH94495.1 hypothetical protein Psi01_51250 [Planobispora siamensis]